MNKSKSRFEDLPNELLTDIFKILNGRDLFRAFSNLNSRLNQLIQSFQYLQLIFHINPSNISKTNDEIFSFYIHTLIIEPWIHFNLKHFPNVRYLRLNDSLPSLLEQLKSDIMPNLEYLSISYTYNMYEIDLLHKRIFSNHFPHLKSYEFLCKTKILMRIQDSTQSPSINILKAEYIDALVYNTILSACPNLYFFQFSMFPLVRSLVTNIQLQHNLKRMIIELKQSEWFYDDNMIRDYLACVPNLEELEIHRRNYTKNIEDYLEHYDWLQSMISFNLPILRKFKFYFHLSNNEKLMNSIDKNMCTRIQRDFSNVHTGQYKAQLVID
jgi:hypothetical protein